MHVTYQIKALDVLVNLDSLKIQNSGIWIRKIRKNRILDREKCVLYKVEPERARRSSLLSSEVNNIKSWEKHHIIE